MQNKYKVKAKKKGNRKGKIQILILKSILTDEQLIKREGGIVSESECSKIIKDNTDAYYIDDITGEKKLLFKFRKNVIPNEICVRAYNALEEHAKKKNHNRGAAAGKLSLKKLPNHVGKVIKTGKYRIFYKTKSGKVSRDNIGNLASSNILGFYDKPDRNEYNRKKKTMKQKTMKQKTMKQKIMIKGTSSSSSSSSSSIATDIHGVPMCRMTKFTRDEPEKWSQVVPLVKQIDNQYKHLVPEFYKNQLDVASMTPKFQIANTAYSTITVNYDWRTSIHKDKNDFEQGFGNLTVLEKAKSGHPECKGYTGAYLAIPKFGVCIDVRQTDTLAMDVHQYHANTEMKGDGRLSVVCYLRQKMINCMKT